MRRATFTTRTSDCEECLGRLAQTLKPFENWTISLSFCSPESRVSGSYVIQLTCVGLAPELLDSIAPTWEGWTGGGNGKTTLMPLLLRGWPFCITLIVCIYIWISMIFAVLWQIGRTTVNVRHFKNHCLCLLRVSQTLNKIVESASNTALEYSRGHPDGSKRILKQGKFARATICFLRTTPCCRYCRTHCARRNDRDEFLKRERRI